MTSNTFMNDTDDLYNEATGEPIAYSKANPPYGKTPLPTHHAETLSTQPEPVMRTMWVPAQVPGKSQSREGNEDR
ncbi:MAG TPA: hypothetical protein VF826_07970 [Chloroflexia bacterium]|jgi:hypothetical protein